MTMWVLIRILTFSDTADLSAPNSHVEVLGHYTRFTECVKQRSMLTPIYEIPENEVLRGTQCVRVK